MKKGILKMKAVFLALLIAAVLSIGSSAKASNSDDNVENWDITKTVTYQKDSFNFKGYVSKNQKEVWIYRVDISKNNKKSKLTIPETIDGKTVTRIGARHDDTEDSEFNKNLVGVWVEEAHKCDGYTESLNNITSVKLPGTITIIQPTTFSGFKDVKSFVIPNKVKKIQYETFYGCDNMQKLTLPEALEDISVHTGFEDCSKIKSIKLSSKNKKYMVKNNMLIERASKKLVWVSGTKKSVNILKGVKEIGAYAFSSNKAESVTIPSSVNKIERGAFAGSHIKKIDISKKNKTYAKDGQCIYNKTDKSLSVAIPDKKGRLTISNKVTLINDAFSVSNWDFYEHSLKYVKLPKYLKTMKACLDIQAMKTYFMGKNPPKIVGYIEYCASLPIFTHVYVPKGSEKLYKDWYKEHDEYQFVDGWHTF